MATQVQISKTALADALAAGPTVDFQLACRATGFGLTAGRAAEKRGELPFRVIRVGRVLRVPSVDLERLLLTPGGDGP